VLDYHQGKIWNCGFMLREAGLSLKNNITKRSRRGRKDAAVNELARGQLLPGEDLIRVDRHREPSIMALFIALSFIVTGVIGVVLSVAMSFIPDHDDLTFKIQLFGRLIILLGPGSISMLMMYWGLSVFRLKKKYFFVTNKRLAVRSLTTWTGKQVTDDYIYHTLNELTELVKARPFFSIHNVIYCLDRTHVYIDVGKKKPKMITLILENDAARFIDAIRMIGVWKKEMLAYLINEPVIKRGKCTREKSIYGNVSEYDVKIIKWHTLYDTDDYEDPIEIQGDRNVECYYVFYDDLIEEGNVCFWEGGFLTVEEAVNSVEAMFGKVEIIDNVIYFNNVKWLD
jgi:hypothetical protein